MWPGQGLGDARRGSRHSALRDGLRVAEGREAVLVGEVFLIGVHIDGIFFSCRELSGLLGYGVVCKTGEQAAVVDEGAIRIEFWCSGGKKSVGWRVAKKGLALGSRRVVGSQGRTAKGLPLLFGFHARILIPLDASRWGGTGEPQLKIRVRSNDWTAAPRLFTCRFKLAAMVVKVGLHLIWPHIRLNGRGQF